MEPHQHWRARERYTVFDSRYGGDAIAALVQAWRDDPQRPRHLHIIALEPGLQPGFHRVPQAEPGVTLDLLAAPLDEALAQLMARIDFARLHRIEHAGAGFAAGLARLAATDARLQCRGLDPQQAGALAAHGFAFDAPGPDGVLRAVFASRKPRPPLPPAPARRAIVVGAGLAGSAACERLCARGWEVALIERNARPAMEASGNHAGIYMPLVSRDDNIQTRLIRSSYLYALRYWKGLGGFGGAIEGAACGVLQIARDEENAQVQRAIARERHYPPDFAQWLEPEAAQAVAGVPAPHGGWLFPQSGWAHPASICDAMLAACGARLTTRFGTGSVTLERRGGDWCVLDASGQVLAQAPVLVLANGTGATALPQAAQLPLATLRGQVSHVDAAALPPLPVALCRDSYVTPASRGICCAGASYGTDADPVLREADHADNLAKLRSLLSDPSLAPDAPLQGRVGFRSVAPDRLPLIGALPDVDAAGTTERLREVPRHPGLYGLLGYASRGVTWAPLAAELLAAQLEGEPLPLEAVLVDALDPARFVLRARRTSRGKPATPGADQGSSPAA